MNTHTIVITPRSLPSGEPLVAVDIFEEGHARPLRFDFAGAVLTDAHLATIRAVLVDGAAATLARLDAEILAAPDPVEGTDALTAEERRLLGL